MTAEVGPLLTVLWQLIDEWRQRGVSTDHVPAAREAYMQAAQDLVDRLPAREETSPEPRNINVDILGLLEQADTALNEGRTREATRALIYCHITPTPWPATAPDRWRALAGRLLNALEGEVWEVAPSS